ncbi:hypothetical protein H696_01325 [Fonticula alba]|uniref:Structure-specific endonuclease subunit SLX1 n=1 Tax=Fonticula alba TaxID=691883 RepID=A0A058ZBW2_FONAL|nr:hypothetical protein H696_01325 [Fonticula alba]KCV71915.1 hypothetical protein H696_01325 [Fonticula alba]|eukprot:XP_009493493.1 hypothetical protein H696_01325 [Fonticula alba]
MVALVYGFPSRLAALQFEWAWQNPHRSRHLTGASEDALPAALPRAPKPGKRPAAGGVTGRLRALAGLLARPAWRCLPLRVHGLPALGDRERRLLGQLMARARELAGKSAAWAPEPAFGPIDQLPFRFPTTGSGEAWNPPAMAPDPEEPRCSVCWRDLRDVPPLAPHRAPPGPGAEVARQLGLDAALLLDEAGVPGPAAGGRPPACAFGPDGRFFVECPTCRAPAHPRCGALFLLGPAAGATPGEGLLLPTAGRCWSTARVTHDPGTPGCLAILAWSECVAAMRTRVKLPPAPSQPGD